MIGLALSAASYTTIETPFNYSNALIVTLAYFIVGGLLLLAHIKVKLDLFEPIVLITFLYIMIFSVTPLINIINNETLCLGVEVMGGGKKATLIYLISYIFFYTGYFYFRKKIFLHKSKESDEQLDDKTTKRIYYTSLSIWFVCYIISTRYITLGGRSLKYILTLGLSGGVIDLEREVQIQFLAQLGYCLIPTLMYIWVYGKNNFMKLLLFFLTLSIYIMNGFRFIIVILLVATAIYHYLRKEKRPSFFKISKLLLIICTMIGVMGYARGGIRSGGDITWSDFNWEIIYKTILENFEIYKPFYGMVQAIPENYNYTLGQQFLYTFTMAVPRAIWPGKPLPLMRELIEASVSEYAAVAGVAWPNIGEYYSEFGVAGCMTIMLIFGALASLSMKLYIRSGRNNHNLIMYSILLPTYLQIVIRGYSPSNFYLLFFLLLPIVLIKFLFRKKIN